MQSITVSNQIIEVLNYLGEKFGIVIDWSSQNVLPYIEQLLGKFISWEIATSWMFIVLGAILLIAGIFFIIFEANTCASDGVFYLLGIVFIIVGSFTIFYQLYDIITATYFPEKTIFDYINYNTNLLK